MDLRLLARMSTVLRSSSVTTINDAKVSDEKSFNWSAIVIHSLGNAEVFFTIWFLRALSNPILNDLRTMAAISSFGRSFNSPMDLC